MYFISNIGSFKDVKTFKETIEESFYCKFDYVCFNNKESNFSLKEYDSIFRKIEEFNLKPIIEVYDLESLQFALDFTDSVKIMPSCNKNSKLISKSNKANFKILTTSFLNEKELCSSILSMRPNVIINYSEDRKYKNLEYTKFLQDKWKDSFPYMEYGFNANGENLFSYSYSLALGCTYFELNFTLDKIGKNHSFSIETLGASLIIQNIKQSKEIIGERKQREISDGEKEILKKIR